jgi:tRNA(fMet)-specific endonuclease VapC
MIYIFDTDHLTLHQRNHPVLASYIRSLDYSVHALATTVISYQEQIGGRFAQVQRAKNSTATVEAYQDLKDTIAFFENWYMFDYDDRSEACFKAARKAGVRIGTMDLRIASIGVALDATIVTRNRKDFQQVPDLKFEDWSV